MHAQYYHDKPKHIIVIAILTLKNDNRHITIIVQAYKAIPFYGNSFLKPCISLCDVM